jgi:DNA-binding YbaB/EbfC family protein
MSKGFSGIPGGGSVQGLLKQAQEMQKKILDAQEALRTLEVEGSSGGSMVTAKINGAYKLLDLQINPNVVDPNDVGMLQDMIIAAVNEAVSKFDKIKEEQLSQVTGGMSLPGLF